MKSRIRFLTGLALFLVALPLPLYPLTSAGHLFMELFGFSVIAHIMAADWLLISRRADFFGPAGFSATQLAIGAPTALFSAWSIWQIARAGDVAWMGAPILVLPALCVWPFVVFALARGPRDRPARSSPDA